MTCLTLLQKPPNPFRSSFWPSHRNAQKSLEPNQTSLGSPISFGLGRTISFLITHLPKNVLLWQIMSGQPKQSALCTSVTFFLLTRVWHHTCIASTKSKHPKHTCFCILASLWKACSDEVVKSEFQVHTMRQCCQFAINASSTHFLPCGERLCFLSKPGACFRSKQPIWASPLRVSFDSSPRTWPQCWASKRNTNWPTSRSLQCRKKKKHSSSLLQSAQPAKFYNLFLHPISSILLKQNKLFILWFIGI